MTELTQNRVKELFIYDENTGLFWWKISGRGRRTDRPAGATAAFRYKQIQVDGRRYYLHVLAWLYVYGSFPTGEIDHIDRNGFNNRITNLRDVTKSQNLSNTGLGYHYDKRCGKWRVQVSHDKIQYHYGLYTTEQEAAEVAQKVRGL